MNFEPLRTFQLSAEHTMRLTQALAPVLAAWGTDILVFAPGSTGASEAAGIFPPLEKWHPANITLLQKRAAVPHRDFTEQTFSWAVHRSRIHLPC